jgi:TonB-dependent receptor
MRDDVTEGTLDWTVPLNNHEGKSSRLKFGGLYRNTSRHFPTRTFYMGYQTQPGEPQLDLSQPPDGIFSAYNVEHYFHLDELTTPLDSYNATMKSAAGYAMGDVVVGQRWRFAGGVRVENTDQHYKTFPYRGSTEGDVSEGGPKHTDVLPSLNVTYKLSERWNLRAAASRTIANPDYAEIVPSEDSEYFEGAVRHGNPKIKHSKISNFDLRSDFYPSIGENLSFGLFFKDIQDPIEWVITGGGSQPEMNPENFARVHNLGAELEFRKTLKALAPKVGDWISLFSVSGNLALVSSNVKLTGDGLIFLTNTERPMMEQSKYVANATLGFDHPKGTSARLLFNTFGKRISAVGAQGLDDTYEMPFDKLDLSCSQRVDSHWGVKLSGSNLLDSSVEYKSGNHPVQKYKLGRTFSAGISYAI